MKKTVLISIAVLIEIEEEELNKDFNELDQLTNTLSAEIDEKLGFEEGSPLGWLSTKTITLDVNSMNCGRCSVCNSWVTDREKPDHIPELCNGAVYDGQLLCDEHLPKDHKWAF